MLLCLYMGCSHVVYEKRTIGNLQPEIWSRWPAWSNSSSVKLEFEDDFPTIYAQQLSGCFTQSAISEG
jgi:hypothetical protein